jgi:hypothetical protein
VREGPAGQSQAYTVDREPGRQGDEPGDSLGVLVVVAGIPLVVGVGIGDGRLL